MSDETVFLVFDTLLFKYITAVPDPSLITRVSRAPDSSLVTIFWKTPKSKCHILLYVIYYKAKEEGDNEPWIRKNVSRFNMQNVHQHQLHIPLGKQYEIIVTAINLEGESSRNLAIPTIIDLRHPGEITKQM